MKIAPRVIPLFKNGNINYFTNYSHISLLSQFSKILEKIFHNRMMSLTRFNKIAIQGTPPMAVDKEALICLSRVYSYYFKCNFPLFYVYPALTRYLSILFLNILTLLACTHSSDNLFHTLMVLCENCHSLKRKIFCMKVNMGTEKICQRLLQYYNLLKISPLLLMGVNPLLVYIH